jgi:hypothetical protein
MRSAAAVAVQWPVSGEDCEQRDAVADVLHLATRAAQLAKPRDAESRMAVTDASANSSSSLVISSRIVENFGTEVVPSRLRIRRAWVVRNLKRLDRRQ